MLDYAKRLFQIDLGMFGATEEDDDDLLIEDDGTVPDDDELDDDEDPKGGTRNVEEDTINEEDDEPKDDDPEGTDSKDKKESALIHYKKMAKEAQRKLAEMEQKLALEEAKKNESTRVQELMKTGMDEDKAKEQASLETRLKALEAENERLKYTELEKDFPGISRFKDEIRDMKAKLPDMAEHEIYLAKFAKRSAFEQKTMVEQEMAYKMRRSKESGSTNVRGTGGSNDKPVKLSRTDEQAYQQLKKRMPEMTRRQFLESLENDQID